MKYKIDDNSEAGLISINRVICSVGFPAGRACEIRSALDSLDGLQVRKPATQQAGKPALRFMSHGQSQREKFVLLFGALLLSLSAASSWAEVFSDSWKYTQSLQVTQTGFIRIQLPVELIGASRSDFGDVRLVSESGQEVPYVLAVPRPDPGKAFRPVNFQAKLASQTTELLIENEPGRNLEGLTLETPAGDFIKAVSLEASPDGFEWKNLGREIPIFRQQGANRLYLDLTRGEWRFIRVRIDDSRTPVIPFTGAMLHGASREVPSFVAPVRIVDRMEQFGQTRLVARLPARNLTVAWVDIHAADPVFTRSVAVISRSLAGSELREEVLARGTIYRLAPEVRAVSARSGVQLEKQVTDADLILRVENQDSPPLDIESVEAMLRPVFLTFHARREGLFRIYTGHPFSLPPKYDLALLESNFGEPANLTQKLGPFTTNAQYQPPLPIPGHIPLGAPLDISEWPYRKSVRATQAGVQKIELDREVLSRAQPDLADLRLMNGTNQTPFILERTSMTRELQPSVLVTNDPTRPRFSRWLLSLPVPGLPVEQLGSGCQTPVFDRQMLLLEQASDFRGDVYDRPLGSAHWIRTPQAPARRFHLTISSRPQTDRLVLETDNQDNPPIVLEQFTLDYPVVNLYFQAPVAGEYSLHYGYPQASRPKYDVALVADQVLRAEHIVASLSPEQILRSQPGRPGTAGWIFWCTLALVVAVLFGLIYRLLPKTADTGQNPPS